MATRNRSELTRIQAGDCDDGCSFPEIEIGEDSASDLLPAGTRVLAPCSECGTPAREELAMSDHLLAGQQRGFARYLGDKLLPLYHWAPRARRAQIIRYGLRPRMRPTTHVGELGRAWRSPSICLADSPRWAWALSGGFRSTPADEWDLWSTTMELLTEPVVMPVDWANGIHEVRTAHRIFKRDLWWVATRTS